MKRYTTALALIATFALAGGAQAQTVDGDQDIRQELRSMVSESHDDADRAVINEFLEGEAAQQAADEYGLDLEEARDGVGTLSTSEAASLVDRILDADGELVGGDTLVITGTTVVIILLILILIKI